MSTRRARAVATLTLGLLLTLPSSAVGKGPTAPAGWRWESFADVQLAVPSHWGRINGSARLCSRTPLPPAVGRPGGVMLTQCSSPGNSAADDGQFVIFQSARVPEPFTADSDDRVTLRAGSARIFVQAPRHLREQIVATVHTIKRDANGCAVRDRIAREPGTRPSPAVAVDTLTGVRSITACLYRLADDGSAGRPDPPLTSSVQLRGQAARAAWRAIAAAPASHGSQDAPRCTDKYGSDIVVLLVRSDQGPARMHLRFSGCRHNGVDDGITVRRLVQAGTYPFVSGANRVYEGHLGPGGKLEALRSRERAPMYVEWSAPLPSGE